MATEVHYRTCPFCEATCGLEIETDGRDVESIRGDEGDVHSHGFLCPKAYGLKELHEDPDRLTTPLVRRDGQLVEASWEEAFEQIDRGLTPILERGGKVVVIDPRRTRTAEEASEHHFIRPGADAHLLLGIACTLVQEGLD